MTKPVTDKDRHPLLDPEDQETLKANYARVRKIRRDIKAKADAARAEAVRESSTRTSAATIGESPFEIGSLDDLLKWENVLKAKKDNVIKLIEIDSANTKLETERGKLIPRPEVEEREANIGDLFRSGLGALVDLVSDWVAPDKIIQAQAAFRERAEAILHQIADSVKK